VLFIVFVLLFSMFVYANSLYYSIILLFIISLLLFMLVVNNLINSLTMLILLIVYIGAIMVLIGYICAICPNLNLSSNTFGFKRTTLFLIIVSLITPSMFLNSFNSKIFILRNYFFNTSGALIFFLVVCLLFITLLIVTSQYLTPKGPFRSLKV